MKRSEHRLGMTNLEKVWTWGKVGRPELWNMLEYLNIVDTGRPECEKTGTLETEDVDFEPIVGKLGSFRKTWRCWKTWTCW